MKKVFVENLYSTNLITLEDHQEIIGLEDGILTSMKNKLTDTIVGLQKKISTRTSGFKGFLYERGTIGLINDIKKFESSSKKIIDPVSYKDIDIAEVNTIVGLKTDLKDITELTSIYFINLKKDAPKVLDRLDDIVSMFIGDDGFRKSFKDLTPELKKADKKFNVDLTNELKKRFDITNKEEKTQLHKIVRSNSELKEILSLLVTINKNFTDKDVLKLNKQIDKIYKKIDMLVRMLENENISASKESIENLVLAISITANYITSISNLYYLHTQVMSTILNIKDVYKTVK